LGKIWGIPIGLHTSWFIFFLFLTWSLAIGYFPREFPQLPLISSTILAVVTSLCFFISVLAHELGHSIVAIRNNIPVRGITLFIFGGVAQIGHEPRSPGAEFRIAIAGPIVSLALAALFGSIWLVTKSFPLLAAPGVYLMRINIILAFFNLIPGFPLDGGRVLRAIVWQYTNNFKRATQIASFTGQVIAFGFIGYGVFVIFQGDLMNGLWMIFIGWFLQNAAASAYSQMNMRHAMTGIKVSQVMSRECKEVPRLVSVNQIIEDYVLQGGQRCFFIYDQGKLNGMITLRDITKLPQSKWRFTTAEQVMIPFNRLTYIDPDTDLIEALQVMDSENIAQIPVVQDGILLGTLNREQIIHYIRLRAELGA
jgi:Zn-dependent protease